MNKAKKQPAKTQGMNRMLLLWQIFFAFLFIALFANFAKVAITGKVVNTKGEATDLLAFADERGYYREEILAERGEIYDHKGEVIAQNINTYDLYAVVDQKQVQPGTNAPLYINDVQGTAAKLAPILEAPVDYLVEQLTPEDPETFQVYFGHYGKGLSQSKKEEIDALEIAGLKFDVVSTRHYPQGMFAAHTLGYALKNEETQLIEGMMGLEATYDEQLSGTNGYREQQINTHGQQLPNSEEIYVAPVNGDDIYLTLDLTIQTFVEDALNQAMEKYTPEYAMAIVAEAKTGKILAMGSRPSFDPNVRDIQSYMNPLTELTYEPGSVMKDVTYAAAIEEGTYSGQATLESGYFEVDGFKIYDHNKVGWGTITFDEGLCRSSNTAIANILTRNLTQEQFESYLEKFGFGQPTNVGLPNENAGIMELTSDSQYITAGFGQGVTATAMQMLQSHLAIANDGKMMKPYFIDKIVDDETGEIIEQNEPTVVSEPISAETAKQVRDLMKQVIYNKDCATGARFAIDGYEIAGKTGTSQMPAPEGGYLSGDANYLYSFIGMAPADDPELIVYTVVNKPKSDFINSTTSIFNPVMEKSLKYLQVQPDNGASSQVAPELQVQSGIMPSLINQNLEKATAQLNQIGIQPIVLGSGATVIHQSHPAGDTVRSNERIIVLTNSSEFNLPNLTGWSYSDVQALALISNLNIEIQGSGSVKAQSTPPNTPVKSGDTLTVSLE
ncbi:MAG: penicillin-binding protein [Culicoidibacterales bacterium]